MTFYAANFVYDNTISSEYGLRISNFNSSEMPYAGANVDLITQTIYRRPKPYLLGVQQTPVLIIPITITAPDQLSATEVSVISKWLFGQMNYKKLQILQPDMQYFYFNCIFKDQQIIRVGNVIRGFNANIVCDSPFAWDYPQIKSKFYDINNYVVDDIITINNTSDNPDYSYPVVAFRMNKFGGGISITNISDNNRKFEFTNISANERITVDNDLQIVSSSIGNNRLSDFSGYKWMRYVPGVNELIINGNIRSISFLNTFARKIS